MTAVASYFKHNPSGAFSVDWYIGKRCNFDCSYCVAYLHDNKSPHVPYDKMKRLVDIIWEKYNKNVFWSLTGGEPTLNPQFLDVCKYIKREKGARFVSITTNGSRTAKYLIELFHFLDSITLSFHFEYMGTKLQEYIDKCVEIENWRRNWNHQQKNNSNFPDWENGYVDKILILRFMVYPGQLNKVKIMEDSFHKHGITNIEYRYIRPLLNKPNETMPNKRIDAQLNYDALKMPGITSFPRKTFQEKAAKEESFYSEDEKKQIQNLYSSKTTSDKKKLKMWFEDDRGDLHDKDFHYNEVNFQKRNSFRNWLCWAGVKHLKISPLGDIFIGSCHVGGKRGNIYDLGNVALPDNPIRCPKLRCTDNLDLKVPKIKDWKYFELIKKILNN